jgi:diguanylate cyclase (GGDEF)-like protein
MNFNTAQDMLADAEELVLRCERLERDLAREKSARRNAEDIAEQGLRALYLEQERLKLVTRVASYANQCSSPLAALRFAVENLCDAFDWPLGHALITNGAPGEEHLEATGIWSLRDPEQYFPFVQASRQLVAPPGPCVPGRLFEEQSPLWVPDVFSQCSFTRSAAAGRCRLRSSIAVPVLVGRELVAALEFYLHDGRRPDDAVLEILLQIGDQIGRVFDRQRNAETLLRNATTDPLTSLPNRAALEHLCNTLFPCDRRPDDLKLALLYIDLDGFKLVNDTLGHAAGDRLLVAMAQRLSGVVAGFATRDEVEGIMLARLGGDEFAVVVKADHIHSVAAEIADAIHACLQPGHRIGTSDVHSMASIGIAFDRLDYAQVEELMRDADVAMVRAKAEGAGQTSTFTDAMRAEALRRLELEAELRIAIDAGAFELHYQPIVSMADRAIMGVEALVRWRRTPDELVMPDVFIGLAETSGLIVPIGTWVLREACRASVRLRAVVRDRTPLYVSINVAAQQFQQKGFVGQVRDILLETGADPAQIRLELTETSALANPEYAQQTVRKLRDMGIRISLDDFGTGYSSLAYLQTIAFDTIKIDSCFVRKQTEQDADWSIVSAVKLLADSMGMAVVVEGVENEFQLAELKEIGCRYGQGYLFERPMTEAEVCRLFA